MKELSTKKMLRDKEARTDAFVQAYVTNGFKPKQAALAAGYSKNINANELLDDPRVMTKLKIEFTKRTLAHDVTANRVMQEFACVAFLDIKELFNDDHTLKALSEMKEEARRAISSIEVRKEFEWRDREKHHVADVIKFCTSSKMDALKSLANCFGMFTTKIEVTADKNLASLIANARKREASRLETEGFMQ